MIHRNRWSRCKAPVPSVLVGGSGLQRRRRGVDYPGGSELDVVFNYATEVGK
jgi:hypothetical protein